MLLPERAASHRSSAALSINTVAMVSARKRSLSEVAGESAEPSPMLHRVRNMWQFACVNQFLVIFGDALKVEEYDVDVGYRPIPLIEDASANLWHLLPQDLEAECLSPHSMALQNIGLGILKFLSSHRSLTYVALPAAITLEIVAYEVRADMNYSTSTPADSSPPKPPTRQTLSAQTRFPPSLPTSMCLPRLVIMGCIT